VALQYAEKHFNFDRKGMFGKRTTMEKILSWKAEMIRTSLRQLNADMSAEAVQAFRNLTGIESVDSTTLRVAYAFCST
jgi:hypothetical protein